ncbi:MAG: methyltransferase, TIGR04325 family [Actinobacteria bacterium]|nr:methyltransferase, TIGR04325 family [Actinomycetota bacterium]
MTRGPAPRAAALLGLLRPAVDEIVVALDERAEAEVAATVARVADKLIRYPYAEPVDRPLAWLHAECSGDWVLTIDDDEIPSRALLDALPELAGAVDVTHFWLPRRWLYPDPTRFLAQPPWRPDYQLRLVLNDPRTVSFPDETHKPISALGPGRYVDAPLYHADCILNPLERRREKAWKYEHSRPGKRVAGRPMNELYYLPETLDDPRTATVPGEDEALIRTVLDAEPVGSPEIDLDTIPRATREQIDRFWQGRALASTAYQARLTVLDDWSELAAGEVRAFDVRAENLGGEVFSWGEAGRPEIRLATRWRDRTGQELVAEGLRTPLPGDLHPGESAIVPVQVAAPEVPGRHRLEIDLVHEHVRWFECGTSVEIDVVGGRRIGLVVDDDAVLRAELARLAEVAPDHEPVVFTPAGEAVAEALGVRARPSLEPYLLDRLPAGPRGAARVVLRTAALVRAARAFAAGEGSSVPHDARTFLEEVSKLEGLVVAARNPPVRAAAVLAARALGVPATLAGDAPRGRLVNRALLSLAERRVSAWEGPSPRTSQLGDPAISPSEPAAAERPEWEYVPEGWARAHADERVKGWNVDAIAEAYRAKWPSFVKAAESGGTLGIYHEAVAGEEVPTDDLPAHNMLVTLGYVLALAARAKERLSILDWGGGSGHYYLLAKALLPGVALEYHCKDVPTLAALGRELLPEVTFHDDDSCLAARYDVVLVSGALQYAEDWKSMLARLGEAADPYLYVTRLPVALESPSFVVVQRAYAYGYDTEYLGWVLNRGQLLERASSAGLRLVREFLLQAWFSAAGAPEDPVGHRGFLWRARTRS